MPDQTVVNGEIVAVNDDGVPSFNLFLNGGVRQIVFYAFDLLILAGTDLRSRPLEQRRALLRDLMPRLEESIRFSENFDVPPSELLEAVRKQGLEGVVAKRRQSTYRPGDRSGDWVKMRANRGQDLVIGGYVPSSNTFDSILVGYFQGADFYICGTHSRRIRSRGSTKGVRAVPRPRAQGLPLRKSS